MTSCHLKNKEKKEFKAIEGEYYFKKHINGESDTIMTLELLRGKSKQEYSSKSEFNEREMMVLFQELMIPAEQINFLTKLMREISIEYR